MCGCEYACLRMYARAYLVKERERVYAEISVYKHLSMDADKDWIRLPAHTLTWAAAAAAAAVRPNDVCGALLLLFVLHKIHIVLKLKISTRSPVAIGLAC